MSPRILVVDDEPDIRDLLTAWLSGEGYACATAGAALEALDTMATQPADVALLDLALPEHDGVWLARRLREADRDLALIMVTGTRRFDAAVEGMRIGVLDYLIKPFTRQQLVQTVDRAVQWRESSQRQKAERDRLEAEIAERSAALAESFTALHVASTGALDALMIALNRCDPGACEHARRVARQSVALGEQLGLPVSDLGHVERGALLHDIGKIAMPDSLVHKPGPLTDAEIATIRTHPRIGHDILAVVPFLRPAAEIVLASHEAWDGSGYPRGLSGTDIPIGARITAVTDTWDALTWLRVYRDPVSGARAAAELVRCAGSQFDPEVVHAWLRLADLGAGGTLQ